MKFPPPPPSPFYIVSVANWQKVRPQERKNWAHEINFVLSEKSGAEFLAELPTNKKGTQVGQTTHTFHIMVYEPIFILVCI
jgi:hypothetical protein